MAEFDGTNWTVYDTTNSGLPNNDVEVLTIDGGGNKWIGTGGGGLAKFDGTNWTVYDESNSGLPSNIVQTIAIDDNGNKWVGTYFKGLAIYNEDGLVSVDESKKEIVPNNLILYQNYPNPFNPTTTINYSIPKTSNVELKVFDILGRKVVELVNEEKPAGNYTVKFNASKLSSGIYFYQLKTNGFVQTQKMILLQ